MQIVICSKGVTNPDFLRRLLDGEGHKVDVLEEEWRARNRMEQLGREDAILLQSATLGSVKEMARDRYKVLALVEKTMDHEEVFCFLGSKVLGIALVPSDNEGGARFLSVFNSILDGNVAYQAAALAIHSSA